MQRSFSLRKSLRVLALTAVSLVNCHTIPLQAQDSVAAAAVLDADIQTIKPFILPNTVGLVQFDPKRISLPPNVQAAIANEPTGGALIQWLDSMRATFNPLLNDQVRVIIDLPYSQAQVPVRIVGKKPANFNLTEFNQALAAKRYRPAQVQGDFVVSSPTGNLEDSTKIAVSTETVSADNIKLSAALASVKSMPIQMLLSPPAYVWSTYEDLMPQLPEKWGGTPTKIVTEGVQWISIGIDPSQMQVQVTIQSKSKAAAERLVNEIPKIAKIAIAGLPSASLKQSMTELLQRGPLTINNDRIEMKLANLQGMEISYAAVSGLLSSIIDPLNAGEKKNRFKQLALGIHNYESAFKTLPPNKEARNADGTCRFSWRVHILPFIGEEKLYAEFKLDEPWDSPHNSKLIEKMPDIFSNFTVPAPEAVRKGYTTIQAPVGEGTIFGGNKAITFSSVGDGLSNTIFFVEVKPERAVPWTAPKDYEFTVDDPAAGLAIGPDGQFLAALGDGSVMSLSGKLPKDTLVHLFQMNDGQVIAF